MIKVLRGLCSRGNDTLCIGTHNGIFHCDEVIAVSILNILFDGRKNVEVIRSRNIEFLNNTTDFMIDVGGGKFDHHQKGGNGKRENGVEYASAGLIWREFGKQVVEILSEGNLKRDSIEKIFNMIDNDIIQNIDREDNGQNQVIHQFQFIKQFLPDWYDSLADSDKNFEDCANITSEILRKIIKGYISNELAKCEIQYRLNSPKYHQGDVLFINAQTMPWLESVIDYNNNNEDNAVNFVVFPYPDGGYALQCVPPSMEDTFSQRISLPNNWAGETTDLANISGVDSATFCHRGKFFARAQNFTDIIKMCNLATEEYYKCQNPLLRKKINPDAK